MARSFIGAVGAAESQTLDFNIGTQEAIEIASVSGHLGFGTITSAATILTRLAQQSLRIEDGTIEILSLDETDVDVFDNDSEVIFEQFLNGIAFDGTTEGGAALSGVNFEKVFRTPILSPINPTHGVINEGSVSAAAATLLIEYRYVRLSLNELAFQFARRRR
jgi:MFS superfamily sulfate permease-like transporter